MKNKLEVVANRFSVIFGGPKNSPCGCMGIECGSLRCSVWWEIALKDQEIREKAFAIYDNHRDEIEAGVRTILTKHILIPIQED